MTDYVNHEEQLRKELTSEFPYPLNERQLWILTKLCKRVRLRARNNAAFNNLFNRLFPYANFGQVTKKHADGTTYPGLAIHMQGSEASYSPDESDAE